MNASYADMYEALTKGKLEGDQQKDAAKKIQKHLVQTLKEKGYADNIPDDDDDDNPDIVIANFVNSVPGVKPVPETPPVESERVETVSQPAIAGTVRNDSRHRFDGLLRTLSRIYRRISGGNN